MLWIQHRNRADSVRPELVAKHWGSGVSADRNVYPVSLDEISNEGVGPALRVTATITISDGTLQEQIDFAICCRGYPIQDFKSCSSDVAVMRGTSGNRA